MLISLLVFVVVAGLVYYLLTLLPLPDPWKRIALILFIVICIVYLLSFFAPLPYWGHTHRLP